MQKQNLFNLHWMADSLVLIPMKQCICVDVRGLCRCDEQLMSLGVAAAAAARASVAEVNICQERTMQSKLHSF